MRPSFGSRIALPLSYGPVPFIFKRLDFGYQIALPLSYGPALLSFSGNFLGINLDISIVLPLS